MTFKIIQPTLLRVAVASVLMGAAVVSQASVIGFDTRYSVAGPQADAEAYRSLIEGLAAAPASSGYCSTSPAAWDGLSNSATCGGPAGSAAFDISARFNVSAEMAGLWSFRVGPDFGMGGALFLDGVAVGFNASDMWWAGSYAVAEEIFTASAILGAGSHVLEAYGIERCCDGRQQAQFRAPGSDRWTTFSNIDGLDRPVDVPEPGSLSLAALGLFGLLASRRRKSVVNT